METIKKVGRTSFVTVYGKHTIAVLEYVPTACCKRHPYLGLQTQSQNEQL
ncbi:MAG: hypothetical protein AAF039_15185 [Bacteroidota bacterium]